MPKPKDTIAGLMNELRNEFRMARDSRFQSRLKGVDPAGSGADYHYRNEREFLHMIERSRHYGRNDPIVAPAIRRLTTNVVQNGFTLDVGTGDEGLNSELTARWEEWGDDADLCHSEGELDWCEIEKMVLSTVVIDGDLLALPLREGSLQMVEAHRLRTPSNTARNVVHGVLLDERARRKEYWVSKEDLGYNRSVSRVADMKRYPARDADGERAVFHVYEPQRFSQRRGVNAVTPISEMVGMHDDIQFATLVKCQMAALIAILRERTAEWEPSGGTQLGPQTTETSHGYIRAIDGVQAGLDIASEKGEKLQAFAANVPSPEFVPHSMLILTFIAVNLDLPVAVLLLDPSNTNFSGWRGAIDQARLRFQQIQRWLAGKFHRRVYRWKVRQWLALDAAMRKVAELSTVNIFGHTWHPPSWDYIEPLKDASADLLQQRNALNSPRRLQARRGRKWGVIAKEIVQDNSLAIREALAEAQRINGEYPEAQVHWRELISLPTPDGIQIALAGDRPDGADQSSQGNNDA